MTPRCGRAMQPREVAAQPADPFPRCGKPAGHAGFPATCLSQAAWRNELERSRRNKETERKARR